MASASASSSSVAPTQTSGVKYIGSKNKLISFIHDALPDEYKTSPGKILDVFTGTTRVAQSFRKRGWKVVSSDLNWASETYANLFLMTQHSDYPTLCYLVDVLNSLPGEPDWITTHYCDVAPVEHPDAAPIRMWSPKNGAKADAIRNKIEEWYKHGDITHVIYNSLIAILIFALDSVDSSVGVQQAYLKDWSSRSKIDMTLKVPDEIQYYINLAEYPIGTHITGDALLNEYSDADVAYLDPPYTTHSYATYYHIWDSITKWDKPEVGLRTNRRIDRIAGLDEFDESMKSPWNTKKSAKVAFERLIERLPVKYSMISYSNESIIPIEDLIEIAKKYTAYKIHQIDYTRNIMSIIGNGANPNNNTKNIEYIITIQKKD